MYGVGYGYSSIGATTKSSGGGSSYDSDAQSYFTANSTLTDVAQKNAINQFVLDLKSNSLWSKGKIFQFAFLGDSTKNKYNLFNPSNVFLYTSGWTFDGQGETGNGTSAYIDTNTQYTSLITDQTSVSGGIYSQTNSASSACEIGITDGGYSVGIQFLPKEADNKTYWGLGDYVLNGSASLIADSRGNLGFSRLNNTTKKVYKNGTSLASHSSSVTNYTDTLSLVFGARRTGASSFISFSSRKITLRYLFSGLNDTEMANLNTCINTLLTTLSIPTW
jgi:hypothetical protein